MIQEKNQKVGKEENFFHDKVIARYQSSNDETIAIVQASNGKYFNNYGYNEDNGRYMSSTGGFDTFEEAEKTLYANRPTAVEIEEEKGKNNSIIDKLSKNKEALKQKEQGKEPEHNRDEAR
ncbi:MAG: hypothetical protein ACI4DN_10300 [Lachnospiraceae bacterium]